MQKLHKYIIKKPKNTGEAFVDLSNYAPNAPVRKAFGKKYNPKRAHKTPKENNRSFNMEHAARIRHEILQNEEMEAEEPRSPSGSPYRCNSKYHAKRAVEEYLSRRTLYPDSHSI